MSVIQYLAGIVGAMQPYSHSDAACFMVPYRLCVSGDLAGEAPEDCLRRFRINISLIEQGDCGLPERTQQLRALVQIESACPAAMPGLWIDRYFEEESLRLIRLLCGGDHSQVGLLSAVHLRSTKTAVDKSLLLFRHEFELHYFNNIGEE